MAIKVTKTQEPEQTTALAQLQTTALFNIEPPKATTSDLLPQFKIPHPIEVKSDKKFLLSQCFKAGIYDGSVFTLLKVPYILTVIMARGASRISIDDPEDKNPDPDPSKRKKIYVRGFKSLGEGMDASHAVYEQHAVSFGEKALGVSYVLGVIQPDNSVCIAELAAFDVKKDYWGKPLFQCRAEAGIGLKVDLEDHSGNQVTSKRTGHDYLSPKKFCPTPVELTREQLASLAECYKAALPKIEAWKKR